MNANNDLEAIYACQVTVPYTNYRGEWSMREIAPIRMFWGSNEWHTEPQWLIEAWDIAKDEIRTFAMSGIGLPGPAARPEQIADALAILRRLTRQRKISHSEMMALRAVLPGDRRATQDEGERDGS